MGWAQYAPLPGLNRMNGSAKILGGGGGKCVPYPSLLLLNKYLLTLEYLISTKYGINEQGRIFFHKIINAQ